MIEAAIVVARWLFFISAMMAFGIALFPFCARGENEPAFVQRLMAAAADAVLVASAAVFALTIVLFGADNPLSFVSMVRTVLLETPFGVPWIIRLATAVALMWAVRARGPKVLQLIAAGLALASAGLTGHAASRGLAESAVVGVHLLAGGAWLGGLVPLAVTLRAQGSRPDGPAAAMRLLLRFSAMGMVSVVLIIASGAVNAVTITGRVPDPAIGYDRILLVKLALVLAMVLLAAVNRFVLVRQLASSPQPALRRIGWTVGLEQILGVLVLIAASILGTTDPRG